MFYSTEILSRRPDGLGIYWLAAILGAGTKSGVSFKKLNKKQLMGCDLVKACEKLVSPVEPLALRFSSNLLCGIARVYQQQYILYQNDVDRFHHSVRYAFSDVYQKSRADQQSSVNLPVHNSTAQPGNHAGINLAIDPDLVLLGWNVDWEVGLGWSSGSQAGRQEEEGEIDLGSGVLFESSAGSIGERGRDRQPSSLHQARDLAAISLAEPQLDDYRFQQDENDMGGMGDYDFPDAMDLQNDYGFGGEGLIAGHSPDLDAAIQAGSSRGGAGSNADSRRRWTGVSGINARVGGQSSSIAGFDQAGEWQEDPFAGVDFGGGEDAFAFQNGESMEERVRREHAEGLAQRDDQVRRDSSLPGDDQMQLDQAGHFFSPGSAHKRDQDAVGINQAEDESVMVKKPKIARKVAYDSIISIEDRTILASRTTYDHRMEAEQAMLDHGRFEKSEKERGLDLIFGVPDLFVADELVDLWKNIQIAPFNGNKYPTSKEQRKQKKLDFPEEHGDPGVGRRVLSELGQGGQDMGGMGDYDFDYPDFRGGEEFNAPIAEGRAAELGLYDDVELGRRATILASQRSSLLPWNMDLATSDAAFDVGVAGVASSQNSVHARVSLDTPFRGNPRSRIGSQGRSSALGSASPRPPGEGLEDLLADDFTGFEGIGEAHNTFSEAEIALATLERESFNFLSFVKRQAIPDANSSLLFSDIVPVASSNSSVASQALYHLLALATKGLVKVAQDEAYGDISVDLLS